MRKKLRKTSAFVCAIAVMAVPMTFNSIIASAEPDAVTSDYTLTIPATLNVENVGWNSIGDISVKGTLETGKKLTVTATSDDEFALVDTSDATNKIGYTINNANAAGTAAGDAATSWEFTTLDSTTPATQAIGIVVDDYSAKPAGTYTDTVTFTAKVESAQSTTTITGTLDDPDDYLLDDDPFEF